MSALLAGIFTAMLLIYGPAPVFGESLAVTYEPSGFASIEAGQITQGMYIGNSVERNWLQKAAANLRLKSVVDNRIAVTIAAELWLTYSFPQSNDLYQGSEPRFRIRSLPGQSFILEQAEGAYSLKKNGAVPLEIGLGYFPFKYNPDVRNLGEYLFRSGTYPGHLTTKFDYPLSKLLGLRISSNLFSYLRQDLLLTSEVALNPLQNFSLSYLAGADIRGVLNAGAGVCFSNLISVGKADSTTTPHVSENEIIVNGQPAGYYTFKGAKLMLRLAFDPKPLFSTTIFGDNDLRLYAETAVLGVRNYPVYYENIGNRIPLVVGFNVPAFKLLDVLAAEIEWYDSPYPNNFYNVYIRRIPLPFIPPDPGYKHNDWKWSFYAKRTFVEKISLIAQVASDHIRMETRDPIKQDRGEALPDIDHWYFILKAAFSF